MADQDTIEKCEKALRQIYWNMIYQEKKRWSKEYPLTDHFLRGSFTDEVHEEMYLAQIMNLLDGLKKTDIQKGKYIIKRHILDGLTEWEVACELKISQQAVNKCKKKCLSFLKEKLVSW